jgi:proteasome accessory factor A
MEPESAVLSSRWLNWCATGLRVLHMPIAWALWLNIYWFALLPQRRHLAAFFASRCIIDGSGFLDRENRYWISARSATVNSTIGFGSYRNERPIFRCDSWLRGLCTDSDWTFRFYRKLFRSRQRIEIAIGDSGLCEQSQYVRLGATSLVFDLVELSTCVTPRLKNPIEAIQRFAKDWMLLASAADGARRQWTALDIQHAYAANVRAMLQTKENVPLEAWKVLDQWQTTLNQLRPTDDEINLPRSMLGRVDWLSKLWLIHQMKSDSTWAVRKKIDLRYHELSDEGYHYRLNQMLGLAPLLMADEKSRARRNPPAESPALKRGYLIREFSESDSQLRVDWTYAELVLEGRLKQVEF